MNRKKYLHDYHATRYKTVKEIVVNYFRYSVGDIYLLGNTNYIIRGIRAKSIDKNKNLIELKLRLEKEN